MLPLQITLEGFMSYRDPATISFEGASLWMLAGDNGAGKSTVFDAMRWTLFGAHRGGRSGHEALIHRDREKLRVAFDLALGDERFRLLRTFSRTGRSTWQIEQLNGEKTHKIPETDMREGYEKWLREHIGMSDETFCAAMYLAQGRGDAILSANPAQRYEMLREIVDISAFAALHERAKTRASEQESAARESERAWQNAPDASAEEIEQLAETLAGLGTQIGENSARREEILQLLPLAAHWQGLETQRVEAQIALDAAWHNLQGAAQIERDFARLSELEETLPPLENYALLRARDAQNSQETHDLSAQLEVASRSFARLTLQLGNARAEQNDFDFAQKQLESARLEAMTRLAELAPQLADTRQIALYEDEIAALKGELARFPTDLSDQISALKTQIERAQQQKSAADALQRFAREKSRFRDFRAAQFAAETDASRLEISLSAVKIAAETGAQNLETARENQAQSAQLLTAAATRHADARAARARFEQVRGETNCYFCGQILTPRHAQQEAQRLEVEATRAQEAENRAQQFLATQNDAWNAAKTHREEAEKRLRTTETALEKARSQAQNSEIAGHESRERAAISLRELSAEFAAIFDAKNSTQWSDERISAALNGDFPGEEELHRLQLAAHSIEDWRRDLSGLSDEENARREVSARLRDRELQLSPLRANLSESECFHVKAEEISLQNALKNAASELKNGAVSAKQAGDAVRALEKAREAAQGEIAQLKSRIAALGAAHIEIARALDASKSPLLKPFLGWDETDFHIEVSRLQSEKARLENGDLRARFASLREAQARATDLQREVSRLEAATQSVPQSAQRAPAALQIEVQRLQNELESGEEKRRAAWLEKAELERRRDHKKQLEVAHLDAQNAARQHKTLADLLGPHQLQRYLLREAENGIIDEANATLDRLSGGTLRLELRADDDEIAGARKTAPKVLDVAVFRADGADNPADNSENGGRGQKMGQGMRPAQGMLPAFLSGSQRFRVAVSLALGIGRFATRGGGTRLETVIIDEGFGSLDKIGRGEMIDELKMLGQELKRVILVSHQEEFAEAFSNRYLIENDGDSSTARLMVT